MNYSEAQDKRMFKIIRTLLIIEEYGFHSKHNPYYFKHSSCVYYEDRKNMPFRDIPERFYHAMAQEVSVTEKEDSILVQYGGMNYRLHNVIGVEEYGWSGCAIGKTPATEKQMDFVGKILYRMSHYDKENIPVLPETSSKQEMQEFISNALPAYKEAQKEQNKRPVRKYSRSDNRPYTYDEEDYSSFGLDASMFY